MFEHLRHCQAFCLPLICVPLIILTTFNSKATQRRSAVTLLCACSVPELNQVQFIACLKLKSYRSEEVVVDFEAS